MSSPTPPTTPRGGSKWGSRLGAAVRRSSTLLTLSRPTTPSPADRDSDTASLRRSTSREAIPASTPSLSTSKLAAAPTASKQGVPPTPIAESPAREDAATQQEAAAATGPSPLANADNQITASPEPAPFVPAALAEEAATSPVGYVPPPVIDSSAGNPGAFTDDPEALPQPDVVKDPYAASNTGPPPPSDAVEEASALAEREVAAEPAPTTEYVPPPVVDSAAANPGAYTDQATELPQPTVAHDPFAEGVAAPVPVAASEPAIMLETHAPEPEEHPQPVAPPMEQSSSYFEDKPMAESMLEYDPAADAPVPVEFAQAVEEHAPVAMPAAAASSDDVFGPVLAVGTAHAVVEEAHHEEDERRPEDREGEAAEYYRTVGPAMPIAEPHQPSEQHQQHPPAEPTPAHAAEESRAAPTFGTGTVYDYLPEYMSPDIWGGAQRGQGGEGSRAHNVWASASTMPAARHEAQGGEEGKAYTGTQPIPIPVPVVLGGAAAASVGNGHGNGGAHSYSESYKMPNPHPEVSYTEDPFADPAPPHVAGHSHPEIAPQPQVMPVESHDDQGYVERKEDAAAGGGARALLGGPPCTDGGEG
ncbi:hypothetical protein BDN70DRAFT_151545 [Pholiota conissans]|uniref:Uncharacterized protein n=1 Tax=Pholiota conissans TaxID=109636 RepID=A0A9P5YVX8_9AGAR|nr:hypothetical protein BDN70DRAFT_151545 [Pholiota conissans]